MTKEAYNFKGAFEEPIVLYNIGNWQLPYGIPLTKGVIFGVTLLVLFLMKRMVLGLNDIVPGLGYLAFIALPWLAAKYLVKINPDGKKLHFYLFDYIKYFLVIKLGKKRYCNDQEVRYMNQTIRFNSVKWQVTRDAATNTIQECQW